MIIDTSIGLKGGSAIMIRTIWTVAISVPVTLILCIIVLIISPFQSSGNLPHLIARLWARTILLVAGIRIERYGLKDIQKGESYIFAANHSSMFDIPILLAALPIQFRWLAKKELFSIPIFGWAMKRVGYIPVDRSNQMKAYKSLLVAATKVSKGVSIIIFPEGTRSIDGSLGQFKPGGFILAIKAQRPVIPVSIIGAYSILPKGTLRIKKAKVKIYLSEPIHTKGMRPKDKDKLMELVRKEVEKGLSYLISGEPSSIVEDSHQMEGIQHHGQ